MASLEECWQEGQTRVDSSCMTPQSSRGAGKVQFQDAALVEREAVTLPLDHAFRVSAV